MKKIYIFTILTLIFALPVKAQQMPPSIMVQPVGTYDGPLQTSVSPVVVELFSSENCPACPPADEYLKTLSQSKGIIALSCHVDYFGKTAANLGRSFCTQRQTDYIEQIGRKSHFTPQMMINGHMSEIGYETDAVAAAIVKGRSEKVRNITLMPKGEGVYGFALSPYALQGAAEIWWAVYQKPRMVNDRGHKVEYNKVISHYNSLGVWRGESFTKDFYPLTDSNSAGFVVVAQEAGTGKIIAAGEYRF